MATDRSSITEGSILSAYDAALKTLTGASGDVEKMYQQGKRRTLSDIAMSSISSGMGNTLNMPSASIAYDEANRPATNVAVAGQRVGVLTELGQVLAGIRSTNMGASTALQTSQISANTNAANARLALQTSQISANADAANARFASQTSLAQSQQRLAMDKYIADLNARTNIELAKFKYKSPGNHPQATSYPGI